MKTLHTFTFEFPYGTDTAPIAEAIVGVGYGAECTEIGNAPAIVCTDMEAGWLPEIMTAVLSSGKMLVSFKNKIDPRSLNFDSDECERCGEADCDGNGCGQRRPSGQAPTTNMLCAAFGCDGCDDCTGAPIIA